MPAKSLRVSAAPGRVAPRGGGELDDDLPPVSTEPSTITTTTIAIPAAEKSRTFGEACLRWPGAVTGGGGTFAWRLRFVAFPLVIPLQRVAGARRLPAGETQRRARSRSEPASGSSRTRTR